MKKTITLLFMSLLLTLVSSMSAYAAEESRIIFDLSNKDIQTQTFVSDNGQEITIGCEFIPSPLLKGVSKPLQPGGITRIWLTGPLSCEFKMDISPDSRITNAYDETYTAIGVVVTDHELTWSATRATYNLDFETPIHPILSSTGYLRAEISGSNLILSETIYGLNNFN